MAAPILKFMFRIRIKQRMAWDSFPAKFCSQVPVANAKLSIGLKVAASLMPSFALIHAS